MLKLTGRAGDAEALSMSWMYQGGKKSEEEVKEDAERFLLGEKFKGEERDKSEVEIVNDSRNVDEGAGGEGVVVGGLLMGGQTVNERNEEVRMDKNETTFMLRPTECVAKLVARAHHATAPSTRAGTLATIFRR
jgi:hypothetical protein